jgi:hypothetical protein
MAYRFIYGIRQTTPADAKAAQQKRLSRSSGRLSTKAMEVIDLAFA